MDIDKVMTEIHLNVIYNWNVVKQDTDIMNILDMDTNKMCIFLKQTNPYQDDSFIQSYIMTMMIMMLYIVASPIRSHIDGMGLLNKLFINNSEICGDNYENDENIDNISVD